MVITIVLLLFLHSTILTEKSESTKNDDYNPFEHRDMEHSNS